MSERLNNNLPFYVLAATSIAALLSYAALDDDQQRFNILEPAVVTEIEHREIIIDDTYVNGAYIGKVISPHITVEQCDDEEVEESCVDLTIRISSMRSETVEQLEIGSTVIVENILI